MSVNGVQHLLSIAENFGIANAVKKNLKKTTVMAVGPRTAKELEANGIHVDLIPEKYTSDGILQCLRQRHAKDKMIFIPRTSEAPPELGESLRAMGNHVEDIYVYRSGLPSDKAHVTSFTTDLADGKIDAILFTSALGVRNFFEMLKNVITEKELKELIAKATTVVAIGPTTAKPLTEATINVDVIPRNHTLSEALEALASFWKTRE